MKLCRQTLGTHHSHTQTCMNNAALAYQDASRLAEAIALYEENLKLKRGKLDPNNPLCMSLHNVAWGYQAAKRGKEAIPLYQEALGIRRLKLGTGSGETLTTLYNLATVYDSMDDFARAEASYQELLTEQRKAGPNNPYILGTLSAWDGYTSARSVSPKPNQPSANAWQRSRSGRPTTGKCTGCRASSAPVCWVRRNTTRRSLYFIKPTMASRRRRSQEDERPTSYDWTR